MLDEDPNIFNVYEPLWVIKEMGLPGNKQQVVMDILKGILTCNFSATKYGVEFLARISKWIALRLNSKAMMSYPFCKIKNGERVCEDMSKTPNYTDHICSTKYNYSVTKLAVPRIPGGNVSSVIPRALKENKDIRFLYIVRDPRGCINSRINLEWIKDYPDPDLPSSVKSICDTTTYNLRYIQRLIANGEDRGRYMILRYRDIAGDPLATAKMIYNFAQFQIEPRLTKWVTAYTKPSKEKLNIEIHKHYSVVRNASANADKWRKESPIERVRIINKNCATLLRILGITADE
jgi:keratan sulfate 6-sulfotransferase 1